MKGEGGEMSSKEIKITLMLGLFAYILGVFTGLVIAQGIGG